MKWTLKISMFLFLFLLKCKFNKGKNMNIKEIVKSKKRFYPNKIALVLIFLKILEKISNTDFQSNLS